MKHFGSTNFATGCRRVFNSLAAISLLICLASAGLWIRSYFGDGGGWYATVASVKFHLGMSRGTVVFNFMPALHRGQLNLHVSRPGPFHSELLLGDWGGRFFLLMLPLWVITLAALVLPTIRIALWSRRRPVLGAYCAKCGYDLRATPDRCPECGNVPAQDNAARPAV